MHENLRSTRDIRLFAETLPPEGRLLGLDPGSTCIGIALTDSRRVIASPYGEVQRTKLSVDMTSIATICHEQKVCALVIGYPVNMDGTEGPRCQSVRQFARDMIAKLGLPVLLWDERLSTSAVTRMMIDEADLSRKRRSEMVDKLAASFMLQGVIDGLQRKRLPDLD
jgi:putative holliday junction resolvase